MVQALRSSRISHRWLLNDGELDAGLLFNPDLVQDDDSGLSGGALLHNPTCRPVMAQ